MTMTTINFLYKIRFAAKIFKVLFISLPFGQKSYKILDPPYLPSREAIEVLRNKLPPLRRNGLATMNSLSFVRVAAVSPLPTRSRSSWGPRITLRSLAES